MKQIVILLVSIITLQSCSSKKPVYGAARAKYHQTHKCNGKKGILTAMGRM